VHQVGDKSWKESFLFLSTLRMGSKRYPETS